MQCFHFNMKMKISCPLTENNGIVTREAFHFYYLQRKIKIKAKLNSVKKRSH